MTFPVAGRIDDSILSPGIDALRSSRGEASQLVVDLSPVEDIDAAGISALLDAQDAAADLGVLLRIVKISEHVRRQLEDAGVAARLGAR